MPNNEYHSLAIELKNPKGTSQVTEKQKKYLDNLRMYNYKTLVSSDYDEICREIISYMSSVRFSCCYCKNNKYYFRFKTKESLANHLRALHCIDPDSHAKMTRSVPTKQVFRGELNYVLINRNLFKITHESPRKYYLQQVDVVDDNEEELDECLCYLDVIYDADTPYSRAKEIIDKKTIADWALRYYSYDDVKNHRFVFYKIVTEDLTQYSFKELVVLSNCED